MIYNNHHTESDIQAFGGYSADPTTGLPQFSSTKDQVDNIVLKATKDVFKYVDTLLKTHQKQILDYSVWYRDRNFSIATYEEYIQLILCHCIVHSQFLAGNVQWEVVPFIRT